VEKSKTDQTVQIPFQPDLPHQRSRYGIGLLNRSNDALKEQEIFESTEERKRGKVLEEREKEREKKEEEEVSISMLKLSI
jgi:hypothetical protein